MPTAQEEIRAAQERLRELRALKKKGQERVRIAAFVEWLARPEDAERKSLVLAEAIGETLGQKWVVEFLENLATSR